ncbi:MAG: hypothetical protein EAX81_03245 [Candidatus Thorarchaeota archaeon]|nr:hypothetical protein [Candidatus Thorarchaeota archaeon]
MEGEEVVPEEIPELRFVGVRLEEGRRRRRLDVIVHLCNVENETDFVELTLLSLPSEEVKTQILSSEDIENEVRFNLIGRKISSENRNEILKEIEDTLEEEGAEIHDF